MPALILIYTLADTLAWASSDKANTNIRGRFEAWATTWVGPRLPCTATELYAARCGILHTLTSKADLTNNGKAREIIYAWGTAKGEDLQETVVHLKKTNLVAVHVNVLFQAIRDAMADMLEKADSDPVLEKRLNEAASLHLVKQDPGLITQYLTLVRNASGV